MTKAVFENVEKEQLTQAQLDVLLTAAKRFSEDASIEGILANEGTSFFRLVCDELEIISALLISDSEICMWLVGGSPRSLQLVPTFLRAVEDLAKHCKCKRIRAVARPGATKMLKDFDYHCTGYAMVKEI